MIKKAIIDADALAYKAALSQQKVNYQWVYKDQEGNVANESDIFENAKDAKLFLEELELLEESTEGWERIKIDVVGTQKGALSALDGILEDYYRTARELSENPEIRIVGRLTASGKKTKDRPLLEHQYQYNRIGLTKPTHLKVCRDKLLKVDGFKLAPASIEADAVVIYLAEQAGEEAMLMSIDKDLSQAEGTHYVNMNPTFDNREIILSTVVGKLYHSKNSRGTVKIHGDGFKWSVFQAMVGDSSDGYHGLQGFGQVAAYKLLDECDSKQIILETAYKYYVNYLKDGKVSPFAKTLQKKKEVSEEIRKLNKDLLENGEASKGTLKYISWEGETVSLTAFELFEQHLNLAWQERGKGGMYFNLKDYIKDEERSI